MTAAVMPTVDDVDTWIEIENGFIVDAEDGRETFLTFDDYSPTEHVGFVVAFPSTSGAGYGERVTTAVGSLYPDAELVAEFDCLGVHLLRFNPPPNDRPFLPDGPLPISEWIEDAPLAR